MSAPVDTTASTQPSSSILHRVRPILATVMAPDRVQTTRQSGSMTMASSTSRAWPNWRPPKEVLDWAVSISSKSWMASGSSGERGSKPCCSGSARAPAGRQAGLWSWLMCPRWGEERTALALRGQSISTVLRGKNQFLMNRGSFRGLQFPFVPGRIRTYASCGARACPPRRLGCGFFRGILRMKRPFSALALQSSDLSPLGMARLAAGRFA